MKRNGYIYALLAGSAVFWGLNFNLAKWNIGLMEPVQLASWRFLLASACIVVYFFTLEKNALSQVRAYWPRYAVIGLTGIFCTNFLVFSGLRQTSEINASLITATNPAVTVLLSALLLRERIRPRQALGIGTAFAGVSFVITGGSFRELGSVSAGDLLVLAGNACWALYGVLGRKYLHGSSPIATSAMTMLFGALCFLPFASPPSSVKAPGELAQVWGTVGVMAVFGTFLAYLWWNKGIERLGANRTSVFFNLVPISTMAFSALAGETIHYSQFFGVALALAGVGLTTMAPHGIRTQHSSPGT